MIYDGKGLIEVVQQLAPLLVVLRTAKAHGVILQAVPSDRQQRMLKSHFAMVAAVAVGPALRGAAPRATAWMSLAADSWSRG